MLKNCLCMLMRLCGRVSNAKFICEVILTCGEYSLLAISLIGHLVASPIDQGQEDLRKRVAEGTCAPTSTSAAQGSC